MRDQLDQPIGSAGSPPYSVFNFLHYLWQIKYDDDVAETMIAVPLKW